MMTEEKRKHYEWMLENLELAELHRYWIVKQLQEGVR
jgi:hypothetical protein